MFLDDLAEGAWPVEWGDEGELVAARTLLTCCSDLRLGLVDGVVMAVAQRLGAEAVATLDVRLVYLSPSFLGARHIGAGRVV